MPPPRPRPSTRPRCRRIVLCVGCVLPYALLLATLDNLVSMRLVENAALHFMSRPQRAVGALDAALARRADVRCGGESARSPQRRFLLLSTQKSGSTWAARRLGTHPQIATADGELVRSLAAADGIDPRGRVAWPAYRALLERAFAAVAADAAPGTLAYGFKLMYDQVPAACMPELAAWVACERVSVVHLVRASTLESFLSYQSQALDAVVGAGAGSGGAAGRIRTNDTAVAARLVSNGAPMMVGVKAAASFVRGVEAEAAAFGDLLRHRATYHRVLYEHLADRADGALHFKAVVAFLGGDAALETWDTLVRLHVRGCASRVANWPAVRAALRGTAALATCDALYGVVT